MSLFFEIIAGLGFLLWFVGVYVVQKLIRHIQREGRRIDTMELTLPLKKHMELSELFGALKSEFDTVMIGQDEFREKIYRQIQRFDTIMRRNERAVKEVAEEDGEEVALPQIGVERIEKELETAGTPTNANPSQSESNVDKQRRLRALWAKNRSM